MRTLIKNIIDTFTARVAYTMAIACTRFLRRVYTTAVVCALLVAVCIAQIALFGQSTPAYAAFNKEINYQGKLTNSSNVAVPDGTYHMRFKLYTVATGGASIWDEDRSTATGDRITVTNGLFSVMLGSSTPLTSVNFDQTLYLGVEIGGSSGSPSWDGEMTPRKKLGAVPAAFVADTVDGLSSEQFLRADATNATNTASTFLTITQNGAGDIANFIGPSSASVLAIRSGGNVGIGTSSPYAKLSVAGQVVGQYFTATGTTASVFPYASTTALSVSGTGYFGTASTTALTISGISGCSGSNALTTNASGVVACGALSTGATYPFTPSTNFNTAVSATSSVLWAQAGLYASSTSRFVDMQTYGVLYAGITGSLPATAIVAQGSGVAITGNAGDYFVEIADDDDNKAVHTTDGVGNVGTLSDTSSGSGVSGSGLTYGVSGTNSSASGAGVNALQYDANGYAIYASGGKNYFEGNVGIGTTSPYAKLSVVGETVSTYFTATGTRASTFPYASSTALTVSGSLYVGSLNGPLQANNGLVSATTSIGVLYGGTGLTSAPSYGQLLLGNSSSGYTLTATSSLGLLGSSSIGVGAIGQLPYYAAASNVLTATSGIFINTSGNVGIGTTDPNAKLEIAGNLYFTANANRTIGFDGAGGVDLSILGANSATVPGGDIFIGAGSDDEVQAAGGSVYIYPGSGNLNGAVVLGHNGSLSFGNVGVGTSTPATKFAVQGNGYVSGSLFVGGAITSTSSTASTFPYASSTALSVSGTGYFGTASTTNLTISGISGCSGSNALTTNSSGVVACGAITGTGGAFPFTPTTNFGVNTSATSTPIWAQAGLYASSTSYFPLGTWRSDGFVGIGTTSPLYALHVASSTSATTGVQDVMAVEIVTSGNPAVGFGPSILFKDAGANADHMGRIAAVYEAISGGGGTKGGALSFYTNPSADLGSANLTERMRISLDGKVGIGTTSPFAALSVVGQTVAAYFTATTSTASTFPYASSTAFSASGTGYFGTVAVGSTTPWGQLSVNPNGIGSGPSFVIGSSTKTDFIVLNNGRVGVGTTSPSGTFAVQGKTGGLSGTGTGDGIFLTAGTSGGLNNNGGVVIITGGIGSDNGLDTDMNGGVVSIKGGNTSGTYGGGVGGDVTIDGGAASGGTVGNVLLASTNLGNVGIGTTSPYAKLSVVGQVAGAYFTATTSTASTFPYASSTALSVSGTGYFGTASTTNLTISGISGCSGSNALTTNASGVVACGAIVGGSGAYPFTPTTHFGVGVSATSTPIWAQAGLYASSTSQFAYATATALTVTGTAYFPGGIWDSSGNVGVGTSSPWAKLSVGSNGGTQPQFVVASSTGSGATSTHFIVDRWGNVAIGSSTVPSSSAVTGTRLYVYSATSGQGSPSNNANDFIIEGGTNNTGLSILNNSSRTGSIVFGNENDNDVAGIIYSHTQATMQLVANANLAQIITSTGNTGFSTSSPWARLSVGSANSTAPQFVIASSSTGIATSTQFIVDALGNVGIGTSSPWAQLSVNPNNAFGPLFAIGSSTATQFLVSNSGSVMIGTTTSLATDKFSINGGNLFIRSLTPQFVLVDTQSTDNNFGMRAQNGIASFFRANNDSTLSAFLTTFDLANLRVGIGTTSPYAKLSVVGQVVGAYFTATTSTASTFPYASTTALSANVICIGGDCQSAWPSGGGAFPFTPATNFGVNTSATSTPIWAQAGLYASSTSYFPFGTWDSSGNVGIGTTSPAAALAFNASTVAAGGINFGSDVNLYRSAADSLKTDDNFYVSTGIVLESGSSGRIYANGGLVNLSSANNARIRTTDSGVVIDRNIADGATTFYVKQLNASATGDLFQLANSSATTTVFTQSGSVGIGTTSPYAKLSVAGQVVGEYFTATSSIASTFPYASSTALSVSGTGYFGTASTTNLTISGISGCSGSNALTTNSSGVVACGAIVGGSGAYPFTPTTHFGVDTSATSTPIWAQAGLYASSTSYFQRAQIGSGSLFNSAMFHIGSSTNSFLQANIQNYSNGGSASSDWIATNDIGTDTTYYVDLGINSSGYNDAAYTITSANDAYLYAQSNALAIGTATSSTLGVIKFHTGGTLAANERMRITSTGLVGIGTTSPYAQLSVVGGGNNGVFPSFVVATTSSWVNGAQQPLFYVTATTSGKLNYSRVAIGTTSPWGGSGLRDQFTVDGRIYSTWRYLSCDVGGSGGTTFTADTAGACGDFAFDFDADATAILTNQAYPPYIELRAGHANPSVGDGSSIRTTVQVASATSSPVFEAWVQASSTTIATTTPLYIVGLVNSLFGADTGTMPTQGAYFIATTSPNWKVVTRSANNVETMTDTGLATSTNQFRKMRIELTNTEAIFLVNGAVIAQHTTNIPTATLAPTTLLANFAGASATANAHRSLYVSLIRFWMDDPVGPTIAGLPSGEEEGGIASEYDFSSYDPISAAAITAPYLVGDQADFKEGTVVAFHEENKARVRVSNKAYDQNTFGVVGMTSVQNLGETNTHTVNVALSGRVPVRVSLENGNIQPGDYLTSSSIPGVAMKATASGSVLGRAIQIYDEVTKEYTDMVMMSVGPGYYTGSVLVQNAQGNVGVGTTSDAFKLTVSGDVGAYGFSAFGKASMMNEISAISDEDLTSYLEKIKNTTISTYRYKDEAATAPLRLGIVADQAPSEILSVSGEDVDVYKLAVLTLGGVKALENKFNALDLRVTALENQIFGFASSTATSTATTTVIADGSFFDQIISHLESLGVRIAQGIAEFKNVIVETLIVGSPEKPSGITLYDEVTGEPYCLTIANGKMKNRPGECSAEEVEETVDTSDETTETESQEQQEVQNEEKDGEASETDGEASDVEGGEEGGGAASEETSDGASGEGGTTSEDASSGDESGGDSSEAGV